MSVLNPIKGLLGCLGITCPSCLSLAVLPFGSLFEVFNPHGVEGIRVCLHLDVAHDGSEAFRNVCDECRRDDATLRGSLRGGCQQAAADYSARQPLVQYLAVRSYVADKPVMADVVEATLDVCTLFSEAWACIPYA